MKKITISPTSKRGEHRFFSSTFLRLACFPNSSKRLPSPSPRKALQVCALEPRHKRSLLVSSSRLGADSFALPTRLFLASMPPKKVHALFHLSPPPSFFLSQSYSLVPSYAPTTPRIITINSGNAKCGVRSAFIDLGMSQSMPSLLRLLRRPTPPPRPTNHSRPARRRLPAGPPLASRSSASSEGEVAATSDACTPLPVPRIRGIWTALAMAEAAEEAVAAAAEVEAEAAEAEAEAIPLRLAPAATATTTTKGLPPLLLLPRPPSSRPTRSRQPGPPPSSSTPSRASG